MTGPGEQKAIPPRKGRARPLTLTGSGGSGDG